jgi:hypothetical protein
MNGLVCLLLMLRIFISKIVSGTTKKVMGNNVPKYICFLLVEPMESYV